MEEYHKFLPRTEQEYLDTRVLDQIKWYDKKSGINKTWFRFLKMSELILALLIPLFAAYITGTDYTIKFIVGLLGIAVSAITGIVTLAKFQENWIEYRTTAESLKLEKFLFLARTGPYKNSIEPFPLFVERFESLISNSTKKWINYINEHDVKKSPLANKSS